MLRVVLIGLLIIAITVLIFVLWAEWQRFRDARERARHERMGG
jgi:hypothetical protein